MVNKQKKGVKPMNPQTATTPKPMQPTTTTERRTKTMSKQDQKTALGQVFQDIVSAQKSTIGKVVNKE